ncbi:MAG: prepilin-type N-terminal cleavage/methylation domain-containing protein [Gammaproteobacteria bacterium]|nr:prepilin-type N-terminal cleavage/methylation domain-containing protein [Gammaproteobacteria bacterium]
MKKLKKQQGYSLIELAIVLLVIGVMIAGALKAKGLITQAKAQSLINQIQQVRAGWYAFQDRYGGFAGDIDFATHVIGNDQIKNGNGDGVIESKAEQGQVWLQLANAGLISGQFDGEETPDASGIECSNQTCLQTPFGGALRIKDYFGNNQNALSTGLNVPGETLRKLDMQFDDGDPTTGIAQLWDKSGVACTVSTWAEAETTCSLVIEL